MKKWAKITAGVGGVLTVGLIAGGVYAVEQNRPMAEVGTGYAAQAACAQTYLQDRGKDSPDIPPHGLTKLLGLDYEDGEATTESTIYTLFNQKAHYIDGVGCVVGKDRPDYEGAVPSDEERARIIDEAGGGIDLAPQPLDDAQAQGKLQQAVDEAMDKGARGVVVMKDGHLRAEGYGDTFSPDTPQLGWSMTKSLANVLAGRAVAEGSVSSITDATPAGYSLDNLMRMNTGLKWHEFYDTDGDTTQMLYREEDMAAYAAGLPKEHEPGDYREYSTGTTNILCQKLQEKTGMGVDMAWELLFKPLGMKSAELAADQSGTLVCGSYAYATPRDWAKLGQFVMHNGDMAKAGGAGAADEGSAGEGAGSASEGGASGGAKLLPEKWMELSLLEERDLGADKNTEWADYSDDQYGKQPELDLPDDAGYGASWWLNRNEDGGKKWADLPEDLYWASGHDGQFMVVVPSEDLVIVRQGFDPGKSIESTGTVELVRAALAATT